MPTFSSLISILRILAELPWDKLKAFGEYLGISFGRTGLYEVLEYQSILELKDKDGKQAIYHKIQTVRFLQNHIIAYQDQAWGDGDIFADYKCSPGKAVDRYREGNIYRILISLRETKNRGDIETFQIERTIKKGFTHTEEDWQANIDHPTHKLSMSVIFPVSRYPKQVLLIAQNIKQTQKLSQEHFEYLPDGRIQVRWSTENVKLFESYIMRWKW